MKFNAKQIQGDWWVVTHKKKGQEFGLKFEDKESADNHAKFRTVQWHAEQMAKVLPTITESMEKTQSHSEVVKLVELCQRIEETRPDFDPEDAGGWMC